MDEDAAEGAAEDWVERFDERYKRTYYFNKRTRKSQWTRPAVLKPAPAQ